MGDLTAQGAITCLSAATSGPPSGLADCHHVSWDGCDTVTGENDSCNTVTGLGDS